MVSSPPGTRGGGGANFTGGVGLVAQITCLLNVLFFWLAVYSFVFIKLPYQLGGGGGGGGAATAPRDAISFNCSQSSTSDTQFWKLFVACDHGGEIFFVLV